MKKKNFHSGASKLIFLVLFSLLVVNIILGASYYYLTHSKRALPAPVSKEEPSFPPPLLSQEDDSFSSLITKRKEVPWDWKIQPIEGVVLELDGEKRILSLQFTWPPHVADTIKQISIGCNESDFWIQDGSIFYKGKDMSHDEFIKMVEEKRRQVSVNEFFDEAAKPGPKSFIGNCQDESCQVIERGCYLII